MRKRKQDIGFEHEEEEDYVVNDRSGRTGFTSVYNNSVTEMVERPHNDRSFTNDDVEHTLGQEIIQHAPFDPFHNNFAFVDNSYPVGQAISPDHSQTSFQAGYSREEYDDFQVNDESTVQQAPCASHAAATAEYPAPFRYESHPYATDAVHVTPLRRHPSERAEYGLAC